MSQRTARQLELMHRNTQSHSKGVRTKLVSRYQAGCCTSPPIEDGEGYDADPTFFLFPLLRWESQFDEVFLRELPINVFVLFGTEDTG